MTVSELNNDTNNTVDWLKIINSRLTIESQLNIDSEILVEKLELILNLLELIKVTSKRTLADLFAFYFLYFNKDVFIVYPFDEYEGQIYGSKKSKQRWEQCVLYLDEFFGPVLQALYAKRYFDKDVQDSAKELTKEVVRDFTAEVSKFNISDEAKQDVVEKLNTIRYIIGYPEEFLDLKKIEEFYDDLELNGTEGIVETYFKIQSYAWKIQDSPNSGWKKNLIKFIYVEQMKYFADDNIFCKLELNVSSQVIIVYSLLFSCLTKKDFLSFLSSRSLSILQHCNFV